MSVFLAAAGRFKMDWLLQGVGVDGEKVKSPSGSWGFAYCHGNRLETIRLHRSREVEPVPPLVDLRTDMAMIYLHGDKEIISPRQVQPFFRRETRRSWAFCHIGEIVHPERLVLNGRYPDGPDPSEVFFMSVLDHFSPDAPLESIRGFLAQLIEEPALSLCLLSPETMVVASWFAGDERSPAKLWIGKGNLVWVVTSSPPPSLPGISWSEMGNRSVVAIFRERHAVI